MNTITRRRYAPYRAGRRAAILDVMAIYRQRRALARLDDRALADIGLTRAEADAEARRPIWDIDRF